jgi:hypothetical protein
MSAPRLNVRRQGAKRVVPSASERFIALAHAEGFELLAAQAGTSLRVVRTETPVSRLGLALSTDVLVTCHDDGKVRLWEISELDEARPDSAEARRRQRSSIKGPYNLWLLDLEAKSTADREVTAPAPGSGTPEAGDASVSPTSPDIAAASLLAGLTDENPGLARFDSDLVTFAGGRYLEDNLQMQTYVDMLATLMAAFGTPLPLSIGLFGEWGSGKSYFMALLGQSVEQLAQGALARRRVGHDSPGRVQPNAMTLPEPGGGTSRARTWLVLECPAAVVGPGPQKGAFHRRWRRGFPAGAMHTDRLEHAHLHSQNYRSGQGPDLWTGDICWRLLPRPCDRPAIATWSI